MFEAVPLVGVLSAHERINVFGLDVIVRSICRTERNKLVHIRHLGCLKRKNHKPALWLHHGISKYNCGFEIPEQCKACLKQQLHTHTRDTLLWSAFCVLTDFLQIVAFKHVECGFNELKSWGTFALAAATSTRVAKFTIFAGLGLGSLVVSRTAKQVLTLPKTIATYN
jgi:hypothetical protein